MLRLLSAPDERVNLEASATTATTGEAMSEAPAKAPPTTTIGEVGDAASSAGAAIAVVPSPSVAEPVVTGAVCEGSAGGTETVPPPASSAESGQTGRGKFQDLTQENINRLFGVKPAAPKPAASPEVPKKAGAKSKPTLPKRGAVPKDSGDA